MQNMSKVANHQSAETEFKRKLHEDSVLKLPLRFSDIDNFQVICNYTLKFNVLFLYGQCSFHGTFYDRWCTID